MRWAYQTRPSEEFFGWRFKNPRRDYRFIFFGNHELDGFLVLGSAKSDAHKSIQLVDWEATNDKIFRVMLKYAIDLCGEIDIQIWSLTLPPGIRVSLERQGFLDTPGARGARVSKFGLMVKALDTSLPPAEWGIGDRALLDISNWRLRMICADGA